MTTINRREALRTATGALVALPALSIPAALAEAAPEAPVAADEAILELGRNWQAALAEWQALYPAYDAADEAFLAFLRAHPKATAAEKAAFSAGTGLDATNRAWNRAAGRVGALEKSIMAAPAETLAGAAVKARIARHHLVDSDDLLAGDDAAILADTILALAEGRTA